MADKVAQTDVASMMEAAADRLPSRRLSLWDLDNGHLIVRELEKWGEVWVLTEILIKSATPCTTAHHTKRGVGDGMRVGVAADHDLGIGKKDFMMKQGDTVLGRGRHL